MNSLIEKRVKQIDRQIEWASNEIGRAKARLKELQDKKHLMLTLPEICPSCKGTGEERYTDAAGSGDWRDCRTCRGIGKVGQKELLEVSHG